MVCLISSDIEVKRKSLLPDFDKSALVNELETRLSLSRRIGLGSMSATTNSKIQALSRKKITTPPLPDHELAVWCAWLPTEYRRFGSYEFDQPPIHVLEAWARLEDANMFDVFAIRTPETHMPYPQTDPALFGIQEEGEGVERYWLLARWAESDEFLISFEEIKQQLKERLRL